MKADNLYPFVAREREVGWLESHLQQVLQGHGRVCFISGEAGVGKTALITEFAKRAQQASKELVVGIGECNAQSGAGDAYLPFREMLRLLTGDTAADLTHPAATDENATRLQRFLKISGEALVESGPDLVGIFIPGGALLARLGGKLVGQNPGLKRLQAKLSGQGAAALPVAGADSLRQDQIFEQYTNVVRGMARACPLLLVLDDLHWADEASMALLFHLARRIEQSKVLVIGSYRPNDIALGRRGDRHPLAPVLNELQRHYGDILLDLQVGDATGQRQLLDALVDVQPNRLGPGFREALWQRTRGHPLFVVELLRHLQESGSLARDAEGRWVEGSVLAWDTMPARIDGVIGERLERLPQALGEILRVASVAGDEFTAEIVARVVGKPEREIIRALSGELDKQHQLVTAQGTSRNGARRASVYRFTHQLFQAYLYDGLDEVERSLLHEDIGLALEEFHGERVADIPVQLAHHFEAAGDLPKALNYRLQAAQRAQGQHANADAVIHFRKTLDLLSVLAAEPGHEAGERDIGRVAREGLADVLAQGGDGAAARATLDALLASGPELAAGDRVRLQRKLGDAWLNEHRFEEALAAYERAEALMGTPDDGQPGDAQVAEWLEIQLQRMLGFYFTNRPLDELAMRVRPLLEQHGSPAMRARFFQHLALGRARAARYLISENILALATEGYRASRDCGQLGSLAAGSMTLGVCHLDRGDAVAAERFLTEGCEHARRAGAIPQLIQGLHWLATTRRQQDQVEEVRTISTETLELATLAANETYITMSRMNLAWVALREGRLEEARSLAQSALERTHPQLPFRGLGEWPMLSLAMRQDRLEDAVQHARNILAPTQRILPAEMSQPLAAAIAAWDTGDREAARQQLSELATLAERAGYF